MTEEPIRLEPTEGQQVPVSSAERMAALLAALALVSGGVIALGNAFRGDGETGAASSPSEAASRRAEETPTQTRSPRPLREFWLQPGAPDYPDPSEPPFPFWGLIRPGEDLVIRSRPQTGLEVGILSAGTLAVAEEWPEVGGDGGWLRVTAPQPEGWVATVRNGHAVAERMTWPSVPVSGDVWGVTAGENGFVAYGWLPGRSDRPQRRFVASSADGLQWEEADVGSHWGEFGAAAWGPAGWLMIEAGYQPGADVWVWQSPDGSNWSALGAMEDLSTLTSLPPRLVGSRLGYLLAADVGTNRVDVWFSRDGVTWSESANPGLGRDGWVGVSAGDTGYYAWDNELSGSRSGARGAYSADGRTWSTVASGPEGLQDIVAVGDEWLAIDADPTSGLPGVWIGDVADQRLTWRRELDAQRAFDGAAVSAVASDGDRAVVFGWDLSTQAPMAWTEGGATWTRTRLPADFGGIPRLAAAGPAGFVVEGSRPTPRGSNPILWHSTDGESWVSEPSPLLDLAPAPSADECGSPPGEMADLALIDRVTAVVCQGDASLTMRAWSASCPGCGPPCPSCFPFGGEPQWLAEPGWNQLFLSPVEDDKSLLFSVVLPPALEWDPAWIQTWVEVTGHFDDPAAASCRWTTLPGQVQGREFRRVFVPAEEWYAGHPRVTEGCRQQFVVTAVTPVAGPEP